MKPIRRQNSIFGVAAVDLFASALGAFMIVSFVLLPYFPNTGAVPPVAPPIPAPPVGITTGEAAALEERIAQLEGELNVARARERAMAEALDVASSTDERQAQLEAELDISRANERAMAEALDEARSTTKKLPALDLIIALDTTSSMTNEVAALREEIASLTTLLSELTENAAVGIIDFKDICEAQALRLAPLTPVDRAAAESLAAFARTMAPGSTMCNNTQQEAYAEALRQATNTPWRPASERRSIVMISDNPAYSHLQSQAVADAQSFSSRPSAKHTVSSVYVNTGSPLHQQARDFMQQVTNAGQGTYIESDQDASLSVTILLAVFRS